MFKVLSNGSEQLISHNNQPLDLNNLLLLNYQLTLDSPATLMGTDILVNSDITAGSLDNEGHTIPTAGSKLTVNGNLSGHGMITDVNSTTTITGGAPTSETIGLVDNSQLYLGSTYGSLFGLGSTQIPLSSMSFMATVDMDSTSTIHFTDNIQSLASFLTSNTGNLLAGETDRAVPGLVSTLAVVHSLTPGYAPQAVFTFGAGDTVTGISIVDKPIMMAGH